MPDYWTRPIQSDRNAQDYDNTKLRPDGQPKRGTIRRWLFALTVCAAGWTALALLTALVSTPR